jgi:putative flavoprotein involved in K+ transport
MTGFVHTVMIGAGQAGLATSRCLTDRGVPHVVLERGRVGHRWRAERWDSFTLLSPNWLTRLPGFAYAGPDPHGFQTGAQVADLLADYARVSAAPVRTGVTVRAVERGPGCWVVRTDAGTWRATNVVVATGDLDRPAVPALDAAFPAGIARLHTSGYRNPAQPPAGGVLVVGAGPSASRSRTSSPGPGAPSTSPSAGTGRSRAATAGGTRTGGCTGRAACTAPAPHCPAARGADRTRCSRAASTTSTCTGSSGTA